MQEKVEDSLEAQEVEQRPDANLPLMFLRHAKLQGGSVRAIGCPFPGNQVLASTNSDNADTNPWLPWLNISTVLHATATTISTT